MLGRSYLPSPVRCCCGSPGPYRHNQCLCCSPPVRHFRQIQIQAEIFGLPEFPPGLRRFCGFVTPASGRGGQPGFQEGQILRILAEKHLDASPHEGASQFVGCSRLITELQLALPESQMQERIPNCIRTVHRRGQIIPPCLIIPVEKVGVTDRDQQPGCCFPLCLWFRQQIPRSPVLLGAAEYSALSASASPSAVSS